MSTTEPKRVLHAPTDDAGGDLRRRVRSLQLPQWTDNGRPRRARLAWTLCLVLAGTTISLAYVASHRSPGEAVSPPSPAVPPPKPVDEAPMAPSGGIALESKGYLIPAHQILVSPKVSGMLRRLRIQEGQRVVKGEILAEVEDTDYRTDYEHCQGVREGAWQRLLEMYVGSRPEEISQAEAELAETNAQLPQAKAEMERGKALLRNNAIPQQDFEVSESKYWALFRRSERLRAILKLMEEGPRLERIDAARADVRQAEADLAKAKWRLENCTIRAPISGTILKKNAEEGNIVNPIAFNGSFSVCEMADLADLEVDLSIQERDISHIFEGQKCKVSSEAYPKRIYDGYVSRLMPIADRAKGAVPVRVKVAVPSREEGVYLKPEMTVNVAFFQRTERLATENDNLIVHIAGVHKYFRRGGERLDVLNGLTLDVPEGEFLGLMGPSGSGKTTLLNLIAGLDRPSTGDVWVGGQRISAMSELQLARWRTRHLGFIFQFYHLLPVLTAYENIELPLLLLPLSAAQRRQQVRTALSLVRLNDRAGHRPGQLSGGQQQRVGIARAIVTDPTLIVADEPTGDLDARSAEEILDLLEELRGSLRKTILLVTHDPRAAARADRILHLDKGQLVERSDPG